MNILKNKRRSEKTVPAREITEAAALPADGLRKSGRKRKKRLQQFMQEWLTKVVAEKNINGRKPGSRNLLKLLMEVLGQEK